MSRGIARVAVYGFLLVWSSFLSAQVSAAPNVERITFLTDGRVAALIDPDGLQLSAEAIELYHDGEPVTLFRLEADESGRYRLAYRAPIVLGSGIHHELVMSGGGLEATQSLTVEFIEGREIQPFGLDSQGQLVFEASFVYRYFPILLTVVGLILIAAALRLWQHGREKPLVRCNVCGETLEPGFDLCVYCTNPGERGKKGFKSVKRVHVEHGAFGASTDPLLSQGSSRPRRPSSASPPKGRRQPSPPLPSKPDFQPYETDPELLGLQQTMLLERAPSLQIVDGPGAGRRFAIRADEITLGSGRDGDIILLDPRVAPRHARILCKGPHYEVEDMSRGKGLKLNGKRVRSGRLNFSDRITLGSTTLLFLPE